MKIVLDLPEAEIPASKDPEDLAREAIEALVMYWLARGEISLERAASLTCAQTKNAVSFKDHLTSMPDVGEDADFERFLDMPRPEVEWGT
jgi:hypothetical protein